MVAEVFPLGNWNNLNEVENSITMRELGLLLKAKYKDIKNSHKFAASLKGIDIPDEEEEEGRNTFEEIQAKADAVLAGKTVEEADTHQQQSFFDVVGIEIEAD